MQAEYTEHCRTEQDRSGTIHSVPKTIFFCSTLLNLLPIYKLSKFELENQTRELSRKPIISNCYISTQGDCPSALIMNESFDYGDASTYAAMRNGDKNAVRRGLVTEASEVICDAFST